MSVDTITDAPPVRELRTARRRTATRVPFEDAKPWTPERVGRLLEVAVLVVGAAFLVSYVVIALLRLRYPYELEWIEGGFVDLVHRVMDGGPIYNRPNLESIPYIYTPLYYWVSAGFASVMGIGFFPLRLVAFLSSLGRFPGGYPLPPHAA